MEFREQTLNEGGVGKGEGYIVTRLTRGHLKSFWRSGSIHVWGRGEGRKSQYVNIQ